MCSYSFEIDFGFNLVVGSCSPKCRVRFAPNEVVTDASFPPGACEALRRDVLAVFGQGGPRTLVKRGETELVGYCPPELIPQEEADYPSRAQRIRDFCVEGLSFRPPRPKTKA